MGRTACTEPQCLYKGALYQTNTCWSDLLLAAVVFHFYHDRWCCCYYILRAAVESFTSCLLVTAASKRWFLPLICMTTARVHNQIYTSKLLYDALCICGTQWNDIRITLRWDIHVVWYDIIKTHQLTYRYGDSSTWRIHHPHKKKNILYITSVMTSGA